MHNVFRIFHVLVLLALPITLHADSGPFPDVPADHWAADAVKQMKDSGIMQGYPDATFQGEKPVTRYELAVALERMVHFIEQSRKPLVETPEPAANEKAAEKPVGSQPAWAKPALDSLVKGYFIPEDSPLLKEGDKPITPDLLSSCLTQATSRLAVIEADRKAEVKSGQVLPDNH